MALNNSHASGCLCSETMTGHLPSGFGNLEIGSCGPAGRARRCCLTLQEVRDVTGHEQLPLHQAGRQHRRNLVSRFSPVDAGNLKSYAETATSQHLTMWIVVDNTETKEERHGMTTTTSGFMRSHSTGAGIPSRWLGLAVILT